MTPDLDTLFVETLVCLAVAQVLLGARSEHHWLRMRIPARQGQPAGPSTARPAASPSDPTQIDQI